MPTALVQGIAPLPSFDDEAPDIIEIQYMPPGTQTITQEVAAKDGKKELVQIRIVVDEETAKFCEESRALIAAAANDGVADRPFFDFAHEDLAAAGEPLEYFWGGDDPEKGGIRCRVRWTPSARDAIRAGEWRRFSPMFHVDRPITVPADSEQPDTYRVAALGANQGGLVNRAAFRTIQPVAAAAPAREMPNPPAPATMTPPTPTEPNPLEAENLALKQQVADLTAKLAELTTEVECGRKQAAQAAVACAAKEGRIAPNPESLALWESRHAADPAGTTAILATLPPNPAFQTIVAAAAAKPSGADLLSQFNSLPREEQTKFFRQHRDALVAAREKR